VEHFWEDLINDLLLTLTQLLSGVSMNPWMIILVGFFTSKSDFLIVLSFWALSTWPCRKNKQTAHIKQVHALKTPEATKRRVYIIKLQPNHLGNLI
jgi:hypothetical protein